MKIDRVIFSTSERFSCFWNLNAKIWRTKLGVTPACLVFGSTAGLSEEHGPVIQMPVIPDLPLLIQITWAKFYYAAQEPCVTTLIGDIDLMPLSTRWFTENIAAVPDDHYVHLDADGITQLNGTKQTWCGRELNQHTMEDLGCPTNMPGHYHCGRGDVLARGLEISGTFEEQIRHIVESGMYNNSRGYRDSDPIEQHNLWCAEELRSTKAIRRQIASHGLKFSPFHLRHGIERITGDRLDRTVYSEGRYRFDEEKLKTGGYVDLHCIRPFDHVDEAERARRWAANEEVLDIAGML